MSADPYTVRDLDTLIEGLQAEISLIKSQIQALNEQQKDSQTFAALNTQLKSEVDTLASQFVHAISPGMNLIDVKYSPGFLELYRFNLELLENIRPKPQKTEGAVDPAAPVDPAAQEQKPPTDEAP